MSLAVDCGSQGAGCGALLAGRVLSRLSPDCRSFVLLPPLVVPLACIHLATWCVGIQQLPHIVRVLPMRVAGTVLPLADFGRHYAPHASARHLNRGGLLFIHHPEAILRAPDSGVKQPAAKDTSDFVHKKGKLVL